MNWKQWIDNRQKLFWFLQIGGWVGYALVNYIGATVWEMRDIYIFVIILNAYAGCLITIPLRYVYQRIWSFYPLWMFSIVLLLCFTSGTLWSVSQKLVHWEIYEHGFRPDNWPMYFKGNMYSVYIVLCWSGLYFGIKYYQLLQSEKQKALKASTMAHEAHLKMLRYQLNPHFLFNTLNAISTLILIKDNKIANEMVTRLSDFLRFTLNTDPITKIELGKEISVLKLYLAIEQVRFEDRLSVELDISEQASQALVPSLILQPLIENSIKYAIGQIEQGGKISIKAQIFANELLLEVSDNGPGADLKNGKLSQSSGVGIANIQDRLKSHYENNCSFVLSNNHPTGLKVNIRIPFECAIEKTQDHRK